MPQKKPIVLVLEDEEILSKALVDSLERTGKYHVLSAQNGKLGLEIVKAHTSGFGFLKNKIGCIVLDQQMPIMNGIQFASQLQKLGRTFTKIPVILCTSFGSAEDIQRTIASKCKLVGTLSKPVPEKELIGLVDSLVLKVK